MLKKMIKNAKLVTIMALTVFLSVAIVDAEANTVIANAKTTSHKKAKKIKKKYKKNRKTKKSKKSNKLKRKNANKIKSKKAINKKKKVAKRTSKKSAYDGFEFSKGNKKHIVMGYNDGDDKDISSNEPAGDIPDPDYKPLDENNYGNTERELTKNEKIANASIEQSNARKKKKIEWLNDDAHTKRAFENFAKQKEVKVIEYKGKETVEDEPIKHSTGLKGKMHWR